MIIRFWSFDIIPDHKMRLRKIIATFIKIPPAFLTLKGFYLMILKSAEWY
jgi:hypothetical protein